MEAPRSEVRIPEDIVERASRLGSGTIEDISVFVVPRMTLAWADSCKALPRATSAGHRLHNSAPDY